MKNLKEYISDSKDTILDIPSKIKHFFRKLARSWDYAKQGYSSEDWDYAYMLKDMVFKLKRMNNELDRFVNILHEEEIKRIRGLIITIIVLIEMDLNHDFIEDVSHMYGDTIVSEPDEEGNVTYTFTYTKGYSREDVMRAYERGDAAQQKNWEQLFETLKKELKNLWI